jgi:hypothetical protein
VELRGVLGGGEERRPGYDEEIGVLTQRLCENLGPKVHRHLHCCCNLCTFLRPSQAEKYPVPISCAPSSVFVNFLYLIPCSPRQGAPDFTCPTEGVMVRPATKSSVVSPERYDTKTNQASSKASLTLRSQQYVAGMRWIASGLAQLMLRWLQRYCQSG